MVNTLEQEVPCTNSRRCEEKRTISGNLVATLADQPHLLSPGFSVCEIDANEILGLSDSPNAKVASFQNSQSYAVAR
jgi:hypothetical protein